MVDLQEDHKHLSQVSHPRLAQTPFRSPQLALFDLGPGEWLLYWKTPELAPHAADAAFPALFNCHCSISNQSIWLWGLMKEGTHYTHVPISSCATKPSSDQ